MVRVVFSASVRVIPQGKEAMPGCLNTGAFIYLKAQMDERLASTLETRNFWKPFLVKEMFYIIAFTQVLNSLSLFSCVWILFWHTF